MPTILSRCDPVGAVVHRGEPAYGVLGEPGGDGGVGAVAEQPQRDVHPDLGATAGEQRALAGEVGALVALGVAERRAVGAELVVERVDQGVVVLADVAAARVDQLAGEGARGRSRPAGCPGSRRRCAVGEPVAVASVTARSAASSAARLRLGARA